MIVVDTSALVAIIKHETEATVLKRAMAEAEVVLVSVATLLEFQLVTTGDRIDADVPRLLAAFRLTPHAVTLGQLEWAIVAHNHFGPGSGHTAKLNPGDCFVYALAKSPVFRCCSRATTSRRPTSRPHPTEGRASVA